MRILWSVVWLCLFRPSPRVFFQWRRSLLRVFGAAVGPGSRIYPGVKIWAPWNLKIGRVVGVADGATLYSQGEIILEDYVTISQEAYICTGTHDYRIANFPLVTKPVIVRRNAWVAARAFVHPGVTIGAGAVVGACAVVTKDVLANEIVAGNPAKVVKLKS